MEETLSHEDWSPVHSFPALTPLYTHKALSRQWQGPEAGGGLPIQERRFP
jgi:hypothetical protein